MDGEDARQSGNERMMKEERKLGVDKGTLGGN